MKKILVLAVALSAVGSAWADFTITPGTVVGLNISGTVRLEEYTLGGGLNDTLAITVPNLFSNLAGLTVLGDAIYVTDINGRFGRIDLATGAIHNTFDLLLSGVEALGDNGTNLLIYDYLSGAAREVNPTTGAVVNTVTLAAGGTGIDGTASTIYLGSYNTGNIAVYDSAGIFQNTILTGLPANGMSGLGYNADSGTIWVSTGFGDDRIREFDSAGNVLSNFAAVGSHLNGLDVVPEPGSLALALLGLLGTGFVRRRGLR